MVASLSLAQGALAQMAKIVRGLMARGEAQPFVDPVDWRGLGLVDYPTIVRTPMDLGTVLRKLELGEYQSAAACGEDVDLVWENCKKYNPDGSDYHKLAVRLKKKFEAKYAKVANKDATLPAAGAERKPPTLEEKTTLSYNLYRINRAELGRVVKKLNQVCPEAIKRINDDEMEFNIDAMSPSAFFDLARLLNSMLPESKKKRSSTSSIPAAPTSGNAFAGTIKKKAKVSSKS